MDLNGWPLRIYFFISKKVTFSKDSLFFSQDEHALGGPSLWNSSIVSTLQEPLSNNSNHSTSIAAEGSTSAASTASTQPASTNTASSRKKTSNRNGGTASKRSNKSKSKLSRVRYFLHPGEPPVGQIVSDSLTDGQDNNNTLSLKQPQVILRNSYIGPLSSSTTNATSILVSTQTLLIAKPTNFRIGSFFFSIIIDIGFSFNRFFKEFRISRGFSCLNVAWKLKAFQLPAGNKFN